MKKIIIVIFVLFALQTSAMSQSIWLSYRPVRSLDYLGNAVVSYNPSTFEIKGNPLANPTIPIILDSSKSASYTYEFVESFKKFTLPFFTKSKITIDSISAKNVVYHSLNIETLSKLKPDQFYVYSGLSADTVNLVLKYDKQKYFGFGKLLDTVKSIIDTIGFIKNPIVNGIANGVVKLVNGGETRKGDSAYIKITIADPQVLYKVQALKYSEITDIGSENIQYFIWKHGNTKPQFLTFPNDNSIGAIYVPFSNKAKKLSPNVSFGVTLVYDKDPLQNNNLNVGFRYIPNLSGKDTTIFIKKDKLDIPGKDPINFWSGHGFLQDVPVGSSVIKKVYYDLYAEEATPDPETGRPRINLFHKIKKQSKTDLRYPELGVIYLQ